MQEFSVYIGSTGVSLLLLAFFLNIFKVLKTESSTYILLNFIGAGISCYASILIHYIPFVVLEAAWSFVALAGLIQLLKNK